MAAPPGQMLLIAQQKTFTEMGNTRIDELLELRFYLFMSSSGTKRRAVLSL